MDPSLFWVLFLWALGPQHSSRAVSWPQGVTCPAPPLCNLTGTWSSLPGNVQVRVWSEGGRLQVEHWSQGLQLHGSARPAGGGAPAFASVLVGSRTTPGLCLQLMLACFRHTLWVTELPLVGSVPGVAYPLRRHVAPSQTGLFRPRPENHNASESSLGIAHHVLVNITLYHNMSQDHVSQEPSDEAAAEDVEVTNIKYGLDEAQESEDDTCV